MVRLNRALAANTIAETISALIIIMVSFGAGIGVYLNVLQGDALVQRTQAHTLLSSLATATKYHKDFVDQTFEQSGLTIQKKILPYTNKDLAQNHQDVYLIHLQAFDAKNRLVQEHKELIYLPDYE